MRVEICGNLKFFLLLKIVLDEFIPAKITVQACVNWKKAAITKLVLAQFHLIVLQSVYCSNGSPVMLFSSNPTYTFGILGYIFIMKIASWKHFHKTAVTCFTPPWYQHNRLQTSYSLIKILKSPSRTVLCFVTPNFPHNHLALLLSEGPRSQSLLGGKLA